jgi:hypothetical protein
VGRRLFTLASAVSLVLCATTLVFRDRSVRLARYEQISLNLARRPKIVIESSEGWLSLSYTTSKAPFGTPGFAVHSSGRDWLTDSRPWYVAFRYQDETNATGFRWRSFSMPHTLVALAASVLPSAYLVGCCEHEDGWPRGFVPVAAMTSGLRPTAAQSVEPSSLTAKIKPSR